MSEEGTGLSSLDEGGIAAAVEEATAAFAAAGSLDELKTARLAHSGDNAPITHANALIRGLDKADKPTAGKLMGAARRAISQALNEATARLEAEAEQRMLAEERVDVTMPSRKTPLGGTPPLDRPAEYVAYFFVGLGWDIAEGPEVEHEWFNFDALNFGPDHPARQMQDTFYIDGVERVGSAEETTAQPGLILRTHTSPVQSHAMLERGAPIYIACP